MANPTPFDLTGTGYCASFNFRRTARAVTTLFDNAPSERLHPLHPIRHPHRFAKIQPVSIGRISEVLIIDRTTLTRSLKLMEKEDSWQSRLEGQCASRFLSLTSKGEKALALAIPNGERFNSASSMKLASNH